MMAHAASMISFEVVRRDVGRHADGDAGRAVHQEFGSAAGRTVGSVVDSL
jgi:hypothetical protein